MFINIYQGFLF